MAGVAKYLSDELGKRPDVELTIVVPGAGRPGSARWGRVEVRRLGRRGPLALLPGTVYDLAAGKREVERALAELEPDLVHFQGTTFLAAGCPHPHVLTIHGIAEKDAVWRGGALKAALLKATEDHGRRLVPNVILIADAVSAVLPPGRPRRTWRIDNPIADSFFEVPWRPEPGRVFCCSRITPRKNILGLIRAFKRLKGGTLRLAGGGDADYLRLCREEADGRVEFLGSLTVDRVREELSRSACFALPSFQETAPLSISEAMAVGVPVVASPVEGVPEMVEDGRTGFLADPRDEGAVAGALRRVLEDPQLALSMSRRARTLAGERYRASVVAEKTLAVYREIHALQ